MTLVIFYLDQTSGECAGVCACDRTHQMDKTAGVFLEKVTPDIDFIVEAVVQCNVPVVKIPL